MKKLISFYFIVCFLNITLGKAIEIDEIESKKHHIKALCLRDESSPIVSIAFAFKGGSAATSLKKCAVLDLTTAMLVNRIGKKLGVAFKEHGIKISLNPGDSFIVGGLTTPLKDLPKALQLFRKLFDDHQMSEKRLKKLKKWRRRAYDAQNEDDKSFSNLVRKSVFGDHPYGRTDKEFKDSLDHVRVKDLEKCYRNFFSRDKLVIGVSGNLSQKKARKVLDKMFGSLPEKSKALKVPEVKLNLDGQTHYVKDEYNQSKIIFLHPSVKLADPNMTKAAILMGVMGKGFSSRLFKQLREVDQVVYSVDCSQNASPHCGHIKGQTETAPENVERALTSIKTQWSLLREKGITEAEFSFELRQLIEQFPFSFLTSKDSAEYILMESLQGRGKEYFENYKAEIERITFEEINQFASEFIKPESLTFFVQGKGAEVVN